MNSTQPFFLLSLVVALACGDLSETNPDVPDSGSDTSPDSGSASDGADGPADSGSGSGAGTSGDNADSFFRFDLAVGGDTLSIDVPCTLPPIPVPGNVQLIGDDEAQGYGIRLFWLEVDVAEPGVFEVDATFNRFGNDSVNVTPILDVAATIDTLEDNRWAGTFDNWSFEVDAETSPQTILVTEGAFDCQLDL